MIRTRDSEASSVDELSMSMSTREIGLLRSCALWISMFFFFFNNTAPPEISPLPHHAPLPFCGPRRSPPFQDPRAAAGAAASDQSEPAAVSGRHTGGCRVHRSRGRVPAVPDAAGVPVEEGARDRKSTRLNSSHGYISYAVFCLK